MNPLEKTTTELLKGAIDLKVENEGLKVEVKLLREQIEDLRRERRNPCS